MKFRTFRNIVSLVLFAAIGGSCYGCYFYWSRQITHQRLEQEQAEIRDRQAHIQRVEKAAEDAAARTAANADAAAAAAIDAALRTKSPGTYWAKATGLRDVDTAALALLDRPVVDKIKDGTRGQLFKVNVYSDDKVRFNRIKVDLDRDDKDDETWTIFADGHIERKVSTRDNAVYDRTDRLELSGWQDMTKAPSIPGDRYMDAPASTSTWSKNTPSDAAMETVLRLPVQEKIKDATKGQSFKINLYSDDGKAFNRAKVDIDRDDKWDESWTFKDGAVEKQVAPADDENYTEVYVAKGGAWLRK